MTGTVTAKDAMGRAGKRVAYHLLQAAVEGLKAVEALIEEIGDIGKEKDDDKPEKQRIVIE
ncbi:MAG: hypothetical protein J5I28_11360 [Acidimicrobiales bacterium]|jgi:hypothetical protein|nr:hypothetical protein [Acidimicrobiales bacterium]